MEMPRSEGASHVTSRPPMAMAPSVRFSRPAIIRSRVDFPHPDGPTKTQNSPSATSRLTPWMTGTSPKDFFTSLRVRPAMGVPKSTRRSSRPS